MKAVKSCNNKSTELALVKIFRKLKMHGWARHSLLPGNPDFVFKKRRIAIFVDGCFWHGHFCRTGIPQNNRQFWRKKIIGNMKRDKTSTKLLQKMGWQTLRIWECSLTNKKLFTFLRILSKAISHSSKLSIETLYNFARR